MTENEQGNRLDDWHLPDMSRLDNVALEQVLRHLSRVTPEGRKRAAKDPVTRMYLQAGIRLLEKNLAAGPGVTDEGGAPPFLAWMSRSRVVAETFNEPNSSGLPRQGTEAAMRDRWEPHSDYLADLLLVALSGANWGLAVSTNDDYVEAMAAAAATDFAAVVHEVCYQDVITLYNSPGFRIQLLAAAMADRYPILRESLASTYDQAIRQRVAYYTDILSRQGVVLRPGYSPQVFADIFSAIAEGITMRMIAGQRAQVVDDEKRQSLLGVGVLAIFSAAIDPAATSETAAAPA